MGQGLVRKGSTGAMLHSKPTPTFSLRDTYGATYTFIEQGHITLVNSGSQPTTPSAGNLVFFSKSRADKMMLSVVGPSGIDYNLQNALFGGTVIRWVTPGDVSAANPINWGMGWQIRSNSGTRSQPTKASTNSMTSLNRTTYQTTTTINTSIGVQSLDTVVWRGNATGLGGFFFFARFGVTVLGTGARILLGFSVLNGNLASDPSTINNTVAIIKDSGDSNWHFLVRNSATLTKQNTGIAITANQVLDIYIHVKPNNNAAAFELRNPVSGALLSSVTLTTGMIDGTVFLYAHYQVQTSAASLSEIALSQIYIESDI